ncbi:hypothetical protein LTR17_016638 [Elasticomyces elasticus]|nr:hypothetical protein LTR17_016638 [Elasticomyces elasticus]
MSFTVSLASPSDVSRIAEIAVRAFDNDAHTQMKVEVQGCSVFAKGMAQGAQSWLASPRTIVIKATDDRTGIIVGFCAWGFRGVPLDATPETNNSGSGINYDSVSDISETANDEDAQVSQAEGAERIAELEVLTDKHLSDFMEKIMPEGSKCIFICSIAVDPRYEGQGIGSLLIEWGTKTADRLGAFSWVHSSEAGWRFYEKHGFKEVDHLTVNLDDWAVNAPEEQKRWGEYTWRYAVRQCAV